MPSSSGAAVPGAPRPAAAGRHAAAGTLAGPWRRHSPRKLQDAPLPRRRAGLLLPLGRGVALVQAHGDARHFGWFHGVKGTVQGSGARFQRACCAGRQPSTRIGCRPLAATPRRDC